MSNLANYWNFESPVKHKKNTIVMTSFLHLNHEKSFVESTHKDGI